MLEQYFIEKLSMDLARKHAAILESECKNACEKFGVEPKDLILEYKGNVEIVIKIKAAHFQINNSFQVNGENITQEIYGVENK